jgi:type IV pilus assembly protein PilW
MRALDFRAAVRGFSLIELMVAMVIGLIGMVIIFQVFQASESVRRTTTGGGDAQQNGAIALYVMEHDLRNAGMGFNDTPYAGCNMVGFDNQQSPTVFPAAPNTMPMTPVRIITGAGATTPDQFSVFYGSQGQIANATTITSNMLNPNDPLHVTTRFGFRPGDLLLVMQPAPPVLNCNFMEVTGVPTPPAGTLDQVNHDVGPTYNDITGTARTVRFNPQPNGGIAYGGANSPNTTRVFNLGNLYDPNAQPVYNSYAIANNTLTAVSGFSSNPASAVADNIVHMRALYGLDDGLNAPSTVALGYTPGPIVAGDGIVDRFVDSTLFNAIAPLPWKSIIAVRVAIVARSSQAEIPTAGVGAPCDTTVTSPAWSGGTFDLSANPEWKCYRYRVYETTIPLRNWIWKSS